MGEVFVLDCTLRDGGYINDWKFGYDAIKFILGNLKLSKVKFIEVGFIKKTEFNPDTTVYPNLESIRDIISPKGSDVEKVGMIDMISPVPLETIPVRTEQDIDVIRVIFKQNQINEGYEYAKELAKLGYKIMIQLVSTNTYSDAELIDTVKKFNTISPYAVYIVDSLGTIKKKDFLRMVRLADEHLDDKIVLGYHSHNNLQHAIGNAEAFVELELRRSIIVDASILGMGRGAGNLNLELFLDYMNENYDTTYRVEHLIEVMDRYLNAIREKEFWGYSIQYYLSARNNCHPNYAKYYYEIGFSGEDINKILMTIPKEDRHIYSKNKAEEYYRKYLDN